MQGTAQPDDNVSTASLREAIKSAILSQDKKLTNWKDEPNASVLMADYTNSLTAHSYHMSKISEWLDLLNVTSDKKKLKKGRSGISPKVIRRLAEWRYASLTSTFLNEKNLFKVRASSPQYLNASVQNEKVLNFQFNSLLNKVKFINDYVRTITSEGTVVVRVGWKEEFQTKEHEEPVIEYVEADEAQTQILQQALTQIAQEQQQSGVSDASETQIFQSFPPDLQESIKASAEYKRPVIAQDTGKTQMVKEEVQICNRPELEVINTQNLIIDPTCKGDFSKAKFCMYVYETSMSELKSAGIYKNLKYIDGSNNGIPSDAQAIANLDDDVFSQLTDGELSADTFKFADKPRQKLTAYEYWGYYDIDGTGIVQSIVATIVNNTIIRMERNPFPDNKFPFVVVPYLPVKESVYGEPDAELISDNQQVVQALMRSIIDINARSANGQTAIPKGFLDPINAKKFRSGEDYEYNPQGMHPNDAVFMHKANEVPQSVMALIQSQMAEAEATTGIKSFQNGLDGNAYGQSVAGMSQAITAITQRESDIIFRLRNGLEELGNKIVAMNQQWLNEEEIIAITSTEFINVRREDLAGDFFLDVDIKSNSESEGKAQQMTFMMQTLGNTVPWEITQMFLTEISRMYNLDSVTAMIQQYKPQPNEQEAELHQLEVQEKQAKIAKQEAERRYYDARSEYIQAQIGNTQSDTDLKNLEFMEQQEGVKHARQKEIVEAQARAQNEGKIDHENARADNALAKVMEDNDAKERLARMKNDTDLAREWDKNRSNEERERMKANNSNQPSHPKMRGVPNPERGIIPDGLYRADAIGNYISGDANTSVNNQI